MTQSHDDPEGQSRRHSDTLLARIDERTENLSKQLEAVWKEVRGATEKMTKEIQASNAVAAEALKEATAKIEQTYVTRDEFNPVKMISFGLVGVVCLTVLVALIAFVVHTPQETHFQVSADRVAEISVDRDTNGHHSK